MKLNPNIFSSGTGVVHTYQKKNLLHSPLLLKSVGISVTRILEQNVNGK